MITTLSEPSSGTECAAIVLAVPSAHDSMKTMYVFNAQDVCINMRNTKEGPRQLGRIWALGIRIPYVCVLSACHPA